MIKDSIIAGLKEAHKSLHYDPPPKPEIGFLCSGECGKKKETHLATVDDHQKYWRCSEDDCTGGTLNSKQSIWFGKANEGLFNPLMPTRQLFVHMRENDTPEVDLYV